MEIKSRKDRFGKLQACNRPAVRLRPGASISYVWHAGDRASERAGWRALCGDVVVAWRAVGCQAPATVAAPARGGLAGRPVPVQDARRGAEPPAFVETASGGNRYGARRRPGASYLFSSVAGRRHRQVALVWTRACACLQLLSARESNSASAR